MTDHPITNPEPQTPIRSAAEISAAPTSHHPSPQSSVWPMALSAGLALIFFGLLTWTAAFSVVGVVTLVLAVVGWVRELVAGE